MVVFGMILLSLSTANAVTLIFVPFTNVIFWLSLINSKLVTVTVGVGVVVLTSVPLRVLLVETLPTVVVTTKPFCFK